MSDVTSVEVPQVAPVVVGTKVTVGAKVRLQDVEIKMVNDRASHFYFRRIHTLLRSLGKMR